MKLNWGVGGQKSSVGGGEASIVSDPGVQWEMGGAGRVTQLFADDSFLPTPKPPRTCCVPLTGDSLRPETGEIGELSPFSDCF
jgi:hypothetical protein